MSSVELSLAIPRAKLPWLLSQRLPASSGQAALDWPSLPRSASLPPICGRVSRQFGTPEFPPHQDSKRP